MSDKKGLPTTIGGTVIYNIPFPTELSGEELNKALKSMSPIVMKMPYSMDYIHSYAQDSPWFAAIANKKLLGTKCPKCGLAHPNPRLACYRCGADMEWFELPAECHLHTFTVCYFGSEAFMDETPYILGLVEWPGVDTLMLTRITGVDPLKPSLDWIGMKLEPKFKWLSEFKPTDVSFSPAKVLAAKPKPKAVKPVKEAKPKKK